MPALKIENKLPCHFDSVLARHRQKFQIVFLLVGKLLNLMLLNIDSRSSNAVFAMETLASLTIKVEMFAGSMADRNIQNLRHNFDPRRLESITSLNLVHDVGKYTSMATRAGNRVLKDCTVAILHKIRNHG